MPQQCLCVAIKKLTAQAVCSGYEIPFYIVIKDVVVMVVAAVQTIDKDDEMWGVFLALARYNRDGRYFRPRKRIGITNVSCIDMLDTVFYFSRDGKKSIRVA